MNIQYNRRHTDTRPLPDGGMTNAQVLAFCQERAAALARADAEYAAAIEAIPAGGDAYEIARAEHDAHAAKGVAITAARDSHAAALRAGGSP